MLVLPCLFVTVAMAAMMAVMVGAIVVVMVHVNNSAVHECVLMGGGGLLATYSAAAARCVRDVAAGPPHFVGGYGRGSPATVAKLSRASNDSGASPADNHRGTKR